MAGIPFFVVPLALSAVTAGNERAEAPASSLGETFYRGMVWRTNGSGAAWARGDLGAVRTIDFIAMLAASAQVGTTIRVRLGATQADVDGNAAPYDSGAAPFIDPAIARDDGLYHSHNALAVPVQARWWRIDIGGHNGDFQASMLVLGKRLTPARYYETTWGISQRDLGGVTIGRNGVPNVSPGAKLRAMEFTLAWIDEAEMDALFQPFDEAMGKTLPFYCCFDPDPTPARQRRTFFGWNEDQPSLGKVAFNRFERKFQILSLF